MTDCIFCKICNGEIPVEKLRDDNHCVVIRDRNPIAPHHVLIIVKQYKDRHLDNVHQMNFYDRETALSSMFMAAKEYAENNGLHESGYRLVINTGPDAGQTVQHMHMHLIGGAPLKNDFGA
jgi:histidine triad (HIT) family protein